MKRVWMREGEDRAVPETDLGKKRESILEPDV